MPIEKDYPLRKGDVVSLRGVVRYADFDTISVEVGHTTIYPDREALDLVQPKFEVGETAWDREKDYYVNVLALNESEAWVESIEGFRQSYVAKVSDLERTAAPEPDEPDEIGAIDPVEDPANVPGVHAPAALDWKPMEGHDPVKAVLEAINAEPVSDAFKGGINGKGR